MKKILLLPLITLAFTACKDATCNIEGVVKSGQNGDTLVISRLQGREFIPTDTLFVNHGQFKISIPCTDSTSIANYYYKRSDGATLSNIFFIEDGNVKIEISEDCKIGGTQNNDIYQIVLDSIFNIRSQSEVLYQNFIASETSGKPITEQEYEKSLARLENRFYDFLRRTVREQISTTAGYFLFTSCFDMYSVEERLELIKLVDKRYQNSAIINQIRENAELAQQTSDGKQYVDVELTMLDGSTKQLSDYVENNDLTLIDCWASWCGPCCNEMPHIVNLYKQYKDKGLEIVGISFDEDVTALRKAIASFKMTWPQSCDLKGWNNKTAKIYGVNSIPHTILIRRDGTIVAQQLRGEALEKAIKKELQ